MPTWPGTLPQTPLADGYREHGKDNVVRTEMDAGVAKTRKRYTAGISVHEVLFRLTTAQVATLESFHEGDTEFGALSFDMPHPRTGSTVTTRFVQPPVYDAEGVNFVVSLVLEVLP